MSLTQAQIDILNKFSGWGPAKVGLGTLLNEAMTTETSDIADLGVTTGKLADLGVTTGKLDNLAVTTGKIAADAVDGTKIADDAVSIEHLDAGITPALLVVGAGSFTTVGGDANESIPVAGLLGTDTVQVWIRKAGATPRTVDSFTPGAGAIAVVMSDDPSNDHELLYTAYRAPA